MILSNNNYYNRERKVEVTHLKGGVGGPADPIITPDKHWPGPGDFIGGTTQRMPLMCYGCGDLWPCRIVEAAEAVARDRERDDWPCSYASWTPELAARLTPPAK